MMVSEKAHILVVDDDRRLRELIVKYLTEKADFWVSSAENTAEARVKLASIAFDLLVLDIMMPGESGLSLTEDLRKQNSTVPILMLTAMGESKDRINGLETGADDYLPKPFEPRELVLRIQSILKRTPKIMDRPSHFRFGPFTLHLVEGKLFKEGIEIDLTQSEIAILTHLASKPGIAIGRSEFTEQPNSRLLDVQIGKLRKKIEPDPHQPRYIQTVRNVGYKLQAEP